MSAELIETLRSIGYLEDKGESVPNQFEYVEPKKSAGGYLYHYGSCPLFYCLDHLMIHS